MSAGASQVRYDRVALRAELRRDEGDRLRVYRCTAHKLSIGCGRNLDDVGISAAETARLGITVRSCIRDGLTASQSTVLLENDIDRCEADLDRALPWWRTLDDVRQRVMLNMCFNLGIATLLTFRGFLAAVRVARWQAAVAAMRDSRWHAQVGARALRLEAMMATGGAAR